MAMKNRTRLLALTAITSALFLSYGTPATAQYAAGLASDQPIFATHDLLTARIEAPLSTLIKDRPEEKYLDGRFFYVDSNGTEQQLDLKLRVRGKYRARKSTCNFPPIRLNFKKGQVKETEFAGQDKLKLVTHCQTGRSSFEQLVLREYLAYRMYQELTDKSFGARLMRITYVDTEGKQDTIEKYGFLIEDNDNIGTRLGLSRDMIHSIRPEELVARQANLVTVFLYMIGNTDYSLVLGPAKDECCHNSILYSAGSPPYTPVPYDFDFSGIVDAPYAEPNPRFKLRSVKSRRYRGRCMNNELLDETFAWFFEKESAIHALIDRQEGLEERGRKEVTRYINAFYADIQNPKTIQRKFINRCI